MASHSSPTNNRMRAIVQRRYGSADTLELAQVAVPRVGPDEVLIEVHAAGVDRGVWHLMTGTPYLVRLLGYGLTKPRSPVLGLDVAGCVVEVGSKVTRFAVGDEVFGIARGSYAEYAAAAESKLARKPATISFEQAAAASISGITALQALTEVATVHAGQNVLIIGASGGVGSYAVQIAGALGARVTAVASSAKVPAVQALGAAHTVAYDRSDYLDGSVRYDLIVDSGGSNRLRKLRKALTPTGTLVIVGGEDGERWRTGIGRQLRALVLSRFVAQRLTSLVSKEHYRWIEQLAGYLAAGTVTPLIGARCTLERSADALRRLEAGTIAGKAVIVVRDAQERGESNRLA